LPAFPFKIAKGISKQIPIYNRQVQILKQLQILVSPFSEQNGQVMPVEWLGHFKGTLIFLIG